MDGSEGYLRTAFLERIAHDLKGPVGVMLGVLDELELSLHEDSAKAARLFAMARRSSRRVLAMADRLELTAQLEGDTVNWKLVVGDLRDAVEPSMRRARDIEARRGVDLSVVQAQEPCPTRLDVAWVTMSLSELILNALRHARSRVLVKTSRAENEVGVCVTDDGVGFSGPVTPRFQPQQRPQGLGLSLCLVEDVTRAHGGRLSIAQAEGGGTCITLHFPAASGA